jgi:hypothetical protein
MRVMYCVSMYRFAGTKPTKIQRIRVREQNAMLVISSRAWLIHSYQGLIQTSPISYVLSDSHIHILILIHITHTHTLSPLILSLSLSLSLSRI